MPHAKILSDQVFNPEIEAYCSKLFIDFPSIDRLDDLCENPGIPSPNVFVGYLHNPTQAVLNEIRNDSRYDGAIVLTNESEAHVPTQQEFEAIRNFLLTKLTENPPTPEQVNTAIGTSPNGRTRWHICEALIAYVKGLPVS